MDKAKASGEGDDEQADNSNSIANTKTKARRKRRGRPLEALDLRFRPLAPHAVSWSCDAELAVALDEAIHIFLPELGRGEGVDEEETAQFSVSLQVAGLFRPEPPINARLCAEEGVDIGYHNDDFTFAGVGSGLVTRSGAALGQTVRVEWSPTGLGHCLRPVLAVLTTSGCLVVVGDVGADDDGGGGGGGGGGLTTATRSFRNWRVLWGLGAGLPVPDEEKGVRSVQDKIVSMAWARHLSAGKALLSYGTDSGQVVILTVELVAASKEAWRVRELSRFDGRGPHHEVRDADSVVCGTAFGLRWSPWLEGRTAMVAYVADNYLGFRRVFVDGEMTVTVDDVDSAAMCLFLGVDAFVEWEDAIWPADDGGWVARGIIATPLVAKAFQVHLCKRLEEPMAPHRTQQCATASPAEDSLSTNPITGEA
ncbi:hypothetical protein XA68_15233 [Ophiocordyceps unilateralis]|uniref:Transcription factor IIIC 90kDa subunit N-terminal domain-containing protein n=1 Tax=Ophiocordyceps unilateralis TaxID=268505 RepID=A0A2A9P8H8_OPHUN|nr:hypothetical protein XA68_15233 [Ophiocordyceps unilateralis]